MADGRLRFNPPPGWPKPPEGWTPPKGWSPDPAWPVPPPGWQLWVAADPADCDPPVLGEGDDPLPAPTTAEPDSSRPSSAGRSSAADAARPGTSDAARRVVLLEAEVASLRAQLDAMRDEGGAAVVLDDELVLQDVGIYRYHHPLENAVAYNERLALLSGRIADVVKAKAAIEMSNMFTFDNSLAKGRKLSSDLGKLMLRAYNAEADNSLRTLRVGNVLTAKNRLEASRAAIVKLGSMMEMRISDAFHALRIEEIELTADYLMKVQEEREAARAERERLREERKVEAELAQ